MTVSKIRSLLYSAAKYLGDFSAIAKAFTTGTAKPLIQRAGRRIYGKIAGRGFNFFK
ncbi:hypothetical protein KKG72_04695 [bacterium]|nr:hypothetical protein [bacterium]